MKKLIFLSLLGSILLSTGCTYKVSETSPSVTLDGTKVDYSNMEQYIKSEQCYAIGSSGSTSIMQAAKKAGIIEIVHVDESREGNTICVIVYGKGK